MPIQLIKKESEFKDRKTFEVALAIVFLKANSGYSHTGTLNYDDTTCDGYCLADELMYSFGLEEEDVLYTMEKEVN